VTAAVALPAADEVYKSGRILALIPDASDRALARWTGEAVIADVRVAVYDPTLCDWGSCAAIPEPEHRRFCPEHRDEYATRLRARLIQAARDSRARRVDLLTGLRHVAEDETIPPEIPLQRDA
jgi:hypothetical protein